MACFCWGMANAYLYTSTTKTASQSSMPSVAVKVSVWEGTACWQVRQWQNCLLMRLTWGKSYWFAFWWRLWVPKTFRISYAAQSWENRALLGLHCRTAPKAEARTFDQSLFCQYLVGSPETQEIGGKTRTQAESRIKTHKFGQLLFQNSLLHATKRYTTFQSMMTVNLKK